METFELLTSDDDANKKPCAKKNINYFTGMIINTGGGKKYEHNDELAEGDVRKDDYELGSDGEENEERKKGKDDEDDNDKYEGLHEFDNLFHEGVGRVQQKDKGRSCDDNEDEHDEEK